MDERKKMILRVSRFFHDECKRGKLLVSLNRPKERVMYALGISRRQLDRVLQEGSQLDINIKVGLELNGLLNVSRK